MTGWLRWQRTATAWVHKGRTDLPLSTTPTPAAPVMGALTVSVIGSTTVTVTWAAATADSATPVTAYVPYQGAAAQATLGAATRTFVFTGLTAGSSYSFQVGAQNSVGITKSNTVTATTSVASIRTRPYPLVASPDFSTAPVNADSIIRHLGYGFNGYVEYSGSAAGWTSTMAGLAATKSNYPLNIQATYKVHTAASLNAILTNLPAAWKPGFRYNYYQEPSGQMTTAALQQQYRDTYSAAAATIRAHPNGGGVSMPWVEWEDFDLTTGFDLTKLTPPAADFGGVLWSIFEYGERIDRLDAQVARVVAGMAKFAPGKPWAMMAGCYNLMPIDGPFTSTQLTNQAWWLTNSFQKLKAAGCVGWAWYNVKFSSGRSSDGESRVQVNPQALSALQAISDAGYTTDV